MGKRNSKQEEMKIVDSSGNVILNKCAFCKVYNLDYKKICAEVETIVNKAKTEINANTEEEIQLLKQFLENAFYCEIAKIDNKLQLTEEQIQKKMQENFAKLEADSSKFLTRVLSEFDVLNEKLDKITEVLSELNNKYENALLGLQAKLEGIKEAILNNANTNTAEIKAHADANTALLLSEFAVVKGMLAQNADQESSRIVQTPSPSTEIPKECPICGSQYITDNKCDFCGSNVISEKLENKSKTNQDRKEYFPTISNYDKEEFEIDGTRLIEYKSKNKKEKVRVPFGITSIGSHAFTALNCPVSVLIPKSVKKIDEYAFRDCHELVSVVLPDGLEFIDWGAFAGCSSLKNIIIPDSVEYIGYHAFEGCTSLESVIIPDSVGPISFSDSFLGCTSLKYNEYSNALYLGNEANPYVILIKAKSDDISECVINTNTKHIAERAFDECGSIKNIIIPKGVYSIGTGAFNICKSLKSIMIPDSVEYIGHYAFLGCGSLKYNEYSNALYLGNEANPYVALIRVKSTDITDCIINPNTKNICGNAFDLCGSITSIIIPDSVVSIGPSAFENCKSLKSIAVPNKVKRIGGEAFRFCRSLESFVVPNNVIHIDDLTFCECYKLTNITLPDSIMTIGKLAFKDCYSLKSITIPQRVEFIDYQAFAGCDSLESITIPDNVTEIVGAGIVKCKQLKSITVSKNNISYCDIDGVLFNKDKTKLICYPAAKSNAEYTIPEGVTEIEYGAFAGCTFIKEIHFPKSLQSIGDSAFADCCSLLNVNIPSIMMDIGDDAFSGCVSLKKFEMPCGLSCLGDNAFKNCTSLESISYLWGLEKIGDFVFSGCKSLKEIFIATGVTEIGEDAFYGCESLVAVHLPDTLKRIGMCAFDGCDELKLFIPESVTDIGYMAFGEHAINVEIDKKNNHFCDIDGVIFNKTRTELIKCFHIESENYTVPNGVVDIEPGAFAGLGNLKFIFIPKSVKFIGEYAFGNCHSLESITISDSVTEIGDEVFTLCDKLKSIIVSKNNVSYCDVDGVLFSKDKTELIHYPAGKAGFSYTIPNGVIKISNDAFHTNGSGALLQKVHLPDTVNVICFDAFDFCPDLLITVESYNKKFCNVDGVLYNKNKTSLIHYFSKKKDKIFNIPHGVNDIYDGAFYGCRELESISIPNTVTRIGEHAFKECTKLKSIIIPDELQVISGEMFMDCYELENITIPRSVVRIDYNAFLYCYGLKKITYKGTQREWERINGCDELGNCIIYCDDGEINKT